MRTYCKGLEIRQSDVWLAYDAWLKAPAGRKNSWRIDEEHGSAQALMQEIA